MSFKVRLTLLCVLAVAVTVVLASVVSYFAVSNRLHDQTDDSVRSDATRLAKLPNPEIALPYFGLSTPNTRDYMRVTFADGRSEAPPNQPTAIPESRVDISIAHGTPRFQLRDAYINGRHLRIASATAPDGRSVQFAQDVDDVDATISDLRTTLLIVGGLSILVAALLALTTRTDEWRRHPIPDRPAGDPGTNRGDRPSQLVTRHMRQHDVRVMPHPPVPVGPAQPSGLDLQDHRCLGSLRLRDLPHFRQYAVLRDDNCAHA